MVLVLPSAIGVVVDDEEEEEEEEEEEVRCLPTRALILCDVEINSRARETLTYTQTSERSKKSQSVGCGVVWCGVVWCGVVCDDGM